MPITPLAEQYLSTFHAGGADFPGGISYFKALGQCNLDYTPASLSRIDMLLDQIHAKQAPQHDAFFKVQANQNFLYFLAFYVGKTIERNNPGAKVEWIEHKELVARSPEMENIWPYRFETSIICTITGGRAQQGDFLPLSSIVIRLFEGPDEKSVHFSARAYIPGPAPQATYYDGQKIQKGDAILYQNGLLPGLVEDIIDGPTDGESLVVNAGDGGGASRLIEIGKDELVLVQRGAKDFKAACIAWLERCAADSTRKEPYGTAHAQFALGNLYMHGLFVPRNVGLAIKLWQNSAAAGYTRAEHEMGALLLDGEAMQGDTAKGLLLLNRAAAKGYAPSQARVGYVYEHGKDFAKAAEWYRKAADQDDEMGLCNLGVLLLQGKGVAKDAAQGIALLTRAAEDGSDFAKYRLAACYERGEEVAQDLQKCVEWYAKAAEQGHGPSINNLADKYEKGLGVPQDLQKAFELYSKAAEMDILAAWYSLGCMYADGCGAPRDLGQARKWLELAARHDFPDAAARLAALQRGG